VDADELAVVQLRLEACHRLADQVGLRADMECDVVAGGFTPVDVGNAQEADPPARPHDQPVGCRLAGVPGGQEVEQAADGGRVTLRQMLTRVRQR
jgi:hypothetical protein